ncbi:sterile alpha motif domain-containing protein 3-like [Corythoichthys intestinalis]|uniref:sterile alpha motif domain-containing protein 3-like n=1 Tax=Corythoichthys intestinalis TaxID=161448 RepID=UPI0025A5A953|nr:sterile alpha motif domain-containing protein 3-like [Corythoichthys intestinalis]XP_057699042.1 sterile alpha motif domain-containing protein 3-like [Corythoichthys intestinalis]XP_057699043.1 sterile alpha motif domain-containing protein 3-like [Corythoichthys intestinalis]
MTLCYCLITDLPERLCQWPAIFVVPSFSFEVEHILSEGNSALMTEGKTTRLTRYQKHNILDVMAAEIYKYKAYPSTIQIAWAAEALVIKHPCLKEKGSKKGYDGWLNSLRFKMGNYRNKLSRAGIKDVAVNAGKRSRFNPEGGASRASIKRPRRGEVNYLPNYPKEKVIRLWKPRGLRWLNSSRGPQQIDMILIHQHMQRTFALRREEIVHSAPPIAELQDRWPALLCEAQLYSEFHRITNQNLPFNFFAALDKYTPQLLKLYKKRKTSSFAQKMEAVLVAYEEQDKNDIGAARTAALAAGLPLYLKEDSSEVFKTCKDDLAAAQEGAVALVAVVNDEKVPAGVPFETQHVMIVLEDQFVMSHRSWADSVVILFGLVYALHLSYPEKLNGFFEFIQVVLLGLDDGRKQLKPKLQALKNELE